MPEVPLTHCLECGYSLEGLPARSRCPECGFEYDEHTRIWMHPAPWRGWIFTPALGLLSMMVGLVDPISGTRRFYGIRVLILIGACVYITAILWLMARVRRSWRQGVFVAVTSKGIAFRTPTAKGIVHWRNIQRIVY